jgi:murein L,D-transpeptidase YafK
LLRSNVTATNATVKSAPVLLSGALLATALATGAAAQTTPSLAVDRIIVDKAEHRMTLIRGNNVIAVYKVALGKGGLAPKAKEGDGRVPEGAYRITERKADSQFYKALRVGYPTKAETEAARNKGIDPGSNIMIHGLPNGMGWIGSWHRLRDWTAGCVALTDAEMDQLWKLVPVGTIVEIRAKAPQRPSTK